MFSTRLERILVFGLVIFAVIPLALFLLFVVTVGNGFVVPFLTTYYVFAIIGLALLMFEQLMNEIRRPVRNPS